MARPKGNKRNVRLSVTLDELDHVAVKELAETMGLSAAWIVRRAVAEFIERHGGEGAVPLPRRDHQAA